MPCYKVGQLPSGVTTTGRTSYRTEAECNQACQEGACCEGTSCTVKPQCQCQGEGKTFKGVGTVCEPNPCLCCNSNGSIKSGTDCQWCWCLCGEGAATYPRFVNVTISGEYPMFQPILFPVQGGAQHYGTFNKKMKSVTATVTLSVMSTPSRSQCPCWRYGEINRTSPIGSGGMTGYVTVCPSYKSLTEANLDFEIFWRDESEYSGFNAESWAPGWSIGVPLGSALFNYAQQSITGRYLSGTCMSDMAGKSLDTSLTTPGYNVNLTINAVQA